MRELTEKKTEIITSPCRMSTSRQTDTRLSLGSNQQPPTSSYFTLTELLVVIGIIAVLAALVVGVSESVGRSTKVDHTRLLLERIETVLEMYRDTYDQYPEIIPPDLTQTAKNKSINTEIAEMLLESDAVEVTAKSGVRDIVDQNGESYEAAKGDVPYVIDPWGNPIHIVRWRTGPNSYNYNYRAPDVWSSGPDGVTTYRRNDDGDADIDEDGTDPTGEDPGWLPDSNDIVNWARK